MQINITASPETTARSKVSPSETYLQTCLLPSGAARPSFELGRGVSFVSEGVLPLSARFLSGVSPRCMKFHGISWNFTLNQALNTSATATYTFRHEKASHPNFFPGRKFWRLGILLPRTGLRFRHPPPQSGFVFALTATDRIHPEGSTHCALPFSFDLPNLFRLHSVNQGTV